MMTEDETRKQLELHGYVPWTLTIADAIESGHEWEPIDLLRAAFKLATDFMEQRKEPNDA